MTFVLGGKKSKKVQVLLSKYLGKMLLLEHPDEAALGKAKVGRFQT